MEQTTKERVKEVAKVSGLSMAAFERKLNWSNGYLNNCSDRMSLGKIKDVVDTFGVDRNWLIAGKGQMFVEKQDEVPVQQEINCEVAKEPVPNFVASSQAEKSEYIHISDYKNLQKTIIELTESNSRLSKELSEQGKRMDVILGMLQSKM